MNEKPASVFGVRHPDGISGLVTNRQPLSHAVGNQLDEPSLIHWHGLIPPWQQDGLPGVSRPAIPSAGSADYDFSMRIDLLAATATVAALAGLQRDPGAPTDHAETDER